MVLARTESDEELFTWVSEQWWAPWVLFAVTMVVGLFMVRSLVVHRGRGPRIERAAASSGMRYSAQDPKSLSSLSFAHLGTAEGTGWTALDVVIHEGRDGIESYAFDVRSWTEYEVVEGDDGERSYRRRRHGRVAASARLVRRHRGATRTAAVTPIGLNAPRLVVARENVASKLFSRVTRLDLDVESELFNRSYHVLCDDRAFARALLDARMVDLMVRSEGRISFEFVGPWVLLYTTRLEPELLPGLARYAEEFRAVVPRLAVERWPSTAQPGLRATIR